MSIRFSPYTRKATVFDEWALVAVLAVWAGMVGTIFILIANYGGDLPWRDDWYMVPALVGKEKNLLQFLWAQYMEHRTPVQKAVYLVLLRASKGDFRIGMIANISMLAVLCLAMILMARHLRGGETRLSDVFFPLALLHLGHADIIFLGNNIQFVISTGLVCIWLLIIVGVPWPLPPKVAVTAGLTLVLLPLSGGHGMIVTPFVAFWLAAGTLLYRRDVTARWIIPFQSACVIVSIASAILYFVGYQSVTPTNPGIGTTLITAARVSGMALGPVGAGTGRVFPDSIIGVLFCGVTLLLFASGIVPLRRGLHGARSAERFRVFEFLIFAAAMAALVLVLAWGRAGLVPKFGLPDRYSLMIVPGLCAVYYAWMLYGSDTTRNRVAITFAIAVLLALPFNVRKCLTGFPPYVTGTRAVEKDIADGVSWRTLAERHWHFLLEWDHDTLIKGMRMLYEAKMGPWRSAAR